MRALPAADLLEAWERGRTRPPLERPLALLEVAGGGEAGPEPARLPVGERDALLLELRASIFGPRLDGVVGCPGCGELLELSLDIDDLRAAREGAAQEPPVVERDGYEVRFRPPDTADLAAIADGGDEASARRRLFELCVVEARREGEAFDAGRLPEEVVAAVGEAMHRSDPRAAVEVALTCPECGHGWASPVDVAAFLWAETDRWARRILGEVHALASAYGWSEDEILRLGPARRRVYLEMIGE